MTYQETVEHIAETYLSGGLPHLEEIEATLYLLGLDHGRQPEQLMSDVQKYMQMTLPSNVYSFFGY